MTKFKRTLIAAFLMIGVAVIALTGTTYAWFVEGKEASVSSFQTSVQSAGGVLVSWDAENWNSTLTVTDDEFKAQVTNGAFMLPSVLKPVSTTNAQVAQGNLYLAKLQSNGVEIGDVQVATDGYIKFDIYFDTATQLELKLDGSQITNNGTQTIALASRMAIVHQGAVAYGSSTEQITALNNKGILGIYEPYATTHTEKGLEATPDGVTAQTEAFPYNGIASAFSGTLNKDEASEGNLVAVTTVDEITDIEISLTAGYNKVSFYIWVEGQDADCNNDLAASSFNVELKFAIVEETTE